MSRTIQIVKDCNQALHLAEYAANFMKKGNPSHQVIERTKLFHTDSVICGISALALRTNAPTVLKNEAMLYEKKSANMNKKMKYYARCFGSTSLVPVEKAILANCSAVREWDSNGTVFGYREGMANHQAGEFGHNDFYPVVVAAALHNGHIDGEQVIKGMILLDEIRGRLAESFSLRKYKIDHVVHGAIASCITYGTMIGANVDQIESAVGMLVSHFIPFRCIRHGYQLSDSKGASAAISTEMAIVCVKRAMMGFLGPRDIFRNPEAIFRLMSKHEPEESPFDILLGFTGDDFSIMGQHFKLGIYEHQSGGAVQGVMELLFENKDIITTDLANIENIHCVIYKDAYKIICGEEKWSPSTRQSADHSMVFIISTIIRKAIEIGPVLYDGVNTIEDLWKRLMLEPKDYSPEAIANSTTQALMKKFTVEYGGPDYDEKYPEGIPTTLSISYSGKVLNSGFQMFPGGHARNTSVDLYDILNYKFNLFGELALEPNEMMEFITNLQNIENLSNVQLRSLYNCNILYSKTPIDSLE
jgi:2-methylcitrate dehydratase